MVDSPSPVKIPSLHHRHQPTLPSELPADRPVGCEEGGGGASLLPSLLISLFLSSPPLNVFALAVGLNHSGEAGSAPGRPRSVSWWSRSTRCELVSVGSGGDSLSSAVVGRTVTEVCRAAPSRWRRAARLPQLRAGLSLAMALAACDGGDFRGRRAMPLCGCMAVRLDVGGAQRSLLPRRLGCGVLMAVASTEVSVSGLLVARLVAACFGMCWRHHGGVACGNQETTHQGHHGGVLVALCRILKQWCVGGVVVACRR